MADGNTVIEGTVKFRDGKKWKSRWCVVRKLSPVADCVQLQVYRDARARCAGAASKASLSLQRYLGCEAGFTLDKHSHTLALLCEDFTAVLAFETRERLMQWQVKLQSHLGRARQWVVVVAAGGRLPAGPARLLLRPPAAALAAGVPPRLLAVWQLSHLRVSFIDRQIGRSCAKVTLPSAVREAMSSSVPLSKLETAERRYGVVEGKFCLEGGSLCGRGEGLHVLVTEQAGEVAREVERAALPAGRARAGAGAVADVCTDARQAELNTIDRFPPPVDLRFFEDPGLEEPSAISPFWPSAERTNFQDLGLGDTASVNETVDVADKAPWNGTGGLMLERCMSCISKLGALSRSSTAALTPGAKHFSPAWTMEALSEQLQQEQVGSDEAPRAAASPVLDNTEEVCRCTDRLPARPPKPNKLELRLRRLPAPPPPPPPPRSRTHPQLSVAAAGPLENYDVPRVPSAEVDGEYYDTPKRLKECLNRELFKVARSPDAHTLVLKKPCGCLLKLGKKTNEPTVVDSDENFQPASCPCSKVTDWAHAWIKLPYCNRNKVERDEAVPNKESVLPDKELDALYAKVDLSRKTRKIAWREGSTVVEGLQAGDVEVDEGPLANYENLSFALSLEHYENAKNLLRRVGITEIELNAIGANLKPASLAATSKANVCSRCGHRKSDKVEGGNDEYLMMEPSSLDGDRCERERTFAAGYTPMSPVGSFAFHTLKYPTRSAVSRLLEEKSASNPALGPVRSRRPAAEARVSPGGGGGGDGGGCGGGAASGARAARGRRSSSVDSSRFLEDVEEFEGSVGSGGSASSLETLRGPADAACACASGARGSGAAAAPAGARDSCSSNDSGVSSWSLRCAAPPAAAPPPAPPPADCTGVTDANSTSSGTSDMSDYVETLSMCSSQSSSDTPLGPCARRAASTLRPRAGPEYRPLAPRR